MPAQRTASGRISRTSTRPKANSETTLKPPKSSARRTTSVREGKASTGPKAEATTTKATSFFHLPAEPRVQTYRQHLVRPYLIGAINRLRPKDLAAFQANRQIYNEAIDVFYKENRFAIFPPPDLKWLQDMGHTNRQQLRNVVVQFPVSVCHRLDEKSIINWLPRKLNILFELLAECQQLSLTLKITVQHLKLLREKDVLRHLKGNVVRATIAEVPDVCACHEEFGAHPDPRFQSMRHLAKERCKDLMRQVELDFTMDCWGKEKTGISVMMVNTHCCLYDSM